MVYIKLKNSKKIIFSKNKTGNWLPQAQAIKDIQDGLKILNSLKMINLVFTLILMKYRLILIFIKKQTYSLKLCYPKSKYVHSGNCA